MEKKEGIGFFEKYLTVWVALCIISKSHNSIRN